MKVNGSEYLQAKKEELKQTVEKLSSEFSYASILAGDVTGKQYQVQREGASLLDSRWCERGFVARAHNGLNYSEYSFNDIPEQGAEATGNLNNVHVEPGKRPAVELRAGPCLEIVSFSDFQCDPLTADFGGEIRLGFQVDGKTRRPVSGGSVSGNIREVQGELYLSREARNTASFSGPETIRMSDVQVTAAG